jgi:hypothetical protein
MTKRRDEATKPRAPLEAAAAREDYKQHLDDRLDEALKETFPASDPIAVTPRRAHVPWPPAESPDRETTKPSA